MIAAKSPLIPQSWLRILLFLLALVILYTLLGKMAAYFLDMAGAIDDDTVFNVSLLVSVVASLAAVYVFWRWVDRKPFKELGFSNKEIKNDIGVGSFLAIAILGAGSLILYFNSNLRWIDIVPQFLSLFWYAALLFLVAGAEELVCRGYILSNMLQFTNKWVALIASAALFAVFHINNPAMNFVTALNLFTGGLLMGINYLYTRNLWYAIFFHFAWNFVEGPILGFHVSGLELKSVLLPELKGNELLTGGQFGFEGSILQSILCLIALMILVLIYEKKYSAPVQPA